MRVGPRKVSAMGLGCMPLSDIPNVRIHMIVDPVSAIGVMHLVFNS